MQTVENCKLIREPDFRAEYGCGYLRKQVALHKKVERRLGETVLGMKETLGDWYDVFSSSGCEQNKTKKKQRGRSFQRYNCALCIRVTLIAIKKHKDRMELYFGFVDSMSLRQL